MPRGVTGGPRTVVHPSLAAGIQAGMATARKITVIVPDDLVRRAKRATGLGLAPTVRRGLELVAAKQAYADCSRYDMRAAATRHPSRAPSGETSWEGGRRCFLAALIHIPS
jgi:hypothetical protein